MNVLSEANVMTFIATANPQEAREFYEGVLGLTFVEDSPFALVFDLHGTMLRIQKVKRVESHTYTDLGWQVADIRAAVQALTDAGVAFERYENMPQDELGIWATPDGSAVAWFRDPDGNLLSLAQLTAGETAEQPAPTTQAPESKQAPAPSAPASDGASGSPMDNRNVQSTPPGSSGTS